MNFFPSDRRLYAAIVLVLVAVIFFALNIFASSAFRMSRIDLTAGQLYTTSKGTRALLKGLKEPITLRFYYSEKVATGFQAERARAERILDLLNEFSALSGGKVVVEVIKPEPFSPEEDEAGAAGLSGAQTPKGETLYLGLEGTNLADGHEVIPYFTSEREPFIEYDIVSLIDRLSRGGTPKIGLISGLELKEGAGGPRAMMAGRGAPYAIYDQLTRAYDVTEIANDATAIPDDLRVLVIAHPVGLSANTLYAIDQYVMRGGRVLALDDPLSEMSTEARMGDPGAAGASDFGPLLKSWGVEVPGSEVVADGALAQQVMVGGQSGQVVAYLPWIALTADETNKTDPVTGNLSSVNLATAGHIVTLKDATTKVTPLLYSSDEAMVVPPDELRYAPDPIGLLRDFKASGERYVLAARITGPAKTAFPDGPPPLPKSTDESAPAPTPLPPEVMEAKNGINVILISDADLLDDKFWVDVRQMQGQRVAVPNAGNGALVLNAIDNLLGSNDLLSLRARATDERNFVVVDQIRRKADERYRAEQEELSRKLQATQQRLSMLEQQGGSQDTGDLTLTADQSSAIRDARTEIAHTRAQLRAVLRGSRKDIDALYAWLRIINIVLVPLVVAAAGVGLFYLRRRRRVTLNAPSEPNAGASS